VSHMTNDPRSALNRLIAAFEAHLDAAATGDELSPAVVAFDSDGDDEDEDYDDDGEDYDDDEDEDYDDDGDDEDEDYDDED